MAREVRRPGVILDTFLAFTVLPLLPADMITAAFEHFAQEAGQVHHKFIPLIRYIRTQWIQRTTPAAMSVYRALARTNNGVESNNAWLKKHVPSNTSVWRLVSVIVDMSEDVRIEHQQVANGIRYPKSRPSAATKAQEVQVQGAWDELDRQEINAIQFVDRVKYRIGGASYRHIQRSNHAAGIVANSDNADNTQTSQHVQTSQQPSTSQNTQRPLQPQHDHDSGVLDAATPWDISPALLRWLDQNDPMPPPT